MKNPQAERVAGDFEELIKPFSDHNSLEIQTTLRKLLSGSNPPVQVHLCSARADQPQPRTHKKESITHLILTEAHSRKTLKDCESTRNLCLQQFKRSIPEELPHGQYNFGNQPMYLNPVLNYVVFPGECSSRQETSTDGRGGDEMAVAGVGWRPLQHTSSPK